MQITLTSAFALLPNTFSGSYAAAFGQWPVLQYHATVPLTAFQTRVSLDERQPSGGVYERFRCSFKLSLNDIDFFAVVPKLGDTFTDADSNIWTVIRSHKGLASWSLGCVRLVISDLFDTVDYQAGSLPNDPLATDAWADRLNNATLPTVAAIACRIQPMAGDVADGLAKRGMRNLYTITMQNRILPRWGDLFVDPRSNERFKILAWDHLQELDWLPEYHCERQP